MTFPDGRCMRGDDPRIHQALSDALGFAVTLAREDQVSHFDRGSVHLMSTGALGWLQSRLSGSRVDERRFRPNIVVAADAGDPERSWLNNVIRIGDEVRLKVTEQTERCRMVTLAQDELPEDPRVLRCITKEADARFGVYADVITSGRISIGQAVTFECAA